MAEKPLTPQQIRDELEKGRAAHEAWKEKLKSALANAGDTLDPAQVARDDLCAFGQFLKTAPLAPWVLERKPYEVIERLHREFHELAGAVVLALQDGDRPRAQEILFGPYREKSRILLAALQKWDDELAALDGRRREDRAAAE